MPHTPPRPQGGPDRSRTDLANLPSHSLVPSRVAWDWTDISAQKLHRLIATGTVKTTKIKQELYVDLDSLEAALHEESTRES